jgi:hypothetical protein
MPLALAAHLALAEGQAAAGPAAGVQRRRRAARVAHGHRVVLREGGAQQLAAFALVGRAGHGHVGNAAQKAMS